MYHSRSSEANISNFADRLVDWKMYDISVYMKIISFHKREGILLYYNY